MLEAVIYDMDGVLVDSEPFWRKAEIEVFAEVGVQLTEAMCASVQGMRIDEVVRHWHSQFPWKGPSLQTIESEIVNRVANFIRSESNLLPGVLNSLNVFEGKGLKLGIASSSPMLLINALVDRFDLRERFSVLHSAEFEKKGKPHPDVYLNAADRINTVPQHCLAIEDSVNGMHAALNANMQVVVVPEAMNEDLPDFSAAHHRLKSLEQVNGDWLAHFVAMRFA